MKTVQPPVRACFNLAQRLAALEDGNEANGAPPKFGSATDYLNYYHQKVVRQVNAEFGQVRVPGFATARPQYAWGVVWGAYLARALGIKRISAIEFGVAGGNGLVVLEVIADKVTSLFGVEIDVYGFDTGCGSPKPTDYRDTPNLFQKADYPMDVEKLKKRLKRAKLVLGDVENTVPAFTQSHPAPAPVAFASFDMALYSCTSKALKLFEADEQLLLPRIQCYMGASMGHSYSDFTADRLAISEFNAAHPLRKISPTYGLEVAVPDSRAWAGRMFLAHIFDHSLYGEDDGLIKIRDNPLLV